MIVSLASNFVPKYKKIGILPQRNVAKKLILRGNEINDKSWNLIPEDLKISFAKLYNKHGKSFFKKAYKELVKYMDLQGFAPKKVKFVRCDKTTAATFDECLNRIGYSINEYKYFYSKPDQLGSLAHELQHCKQSVNLIRSKSVGAEGYADAISERLVCERIKKMKDNGSFKLAYEKALKNGNLDEFLNSQKKYFYKIIFPLVRKNFSKAIRMPKLDETPAQKIEIMKNLNALRYYVQPSESFLNSVKYSRNFREIEAHYAGIEMERYYKTFERFLEDFSRKSSAN